MTEFGEYDRKAQEEFLRYLEGGGVEAPRPRFPWLRAAGVLAAVLVVLALVCLWMSILSSEPPAPSRERPQGGDDEELVAERHSGGMLCGW
jgi:hypothetical protein